MKFFNSSAVAVTLFTAVVSAGVLLTRSNAFAQAQENTAEADNAIARAFRDEWLKKFEGTLPVMPPFPPGLDVTAITGEPEFVQWRDFGLSLGLMAKQLMVDPNRRVMPSATGTITRTAVQLLLMAFVGDNTLGGIGGANVPRVVYDEQIADEQAQVRLNLMAQAVRLYVGEAAGEAFRTASASAKVELATRAALGMIEEQKKTWPNAMLLLYATMGRIETDMIADLLGRDSDAFRQFMREPSLRVRSMYVAEGFAAMMKKVGETPLSGPDFDRFATEVMEIKLDRERENPERAVLEALGKAGQESYRKASRNEREEIVNAALLLKAIGATSWSFATFTPETIASVVGK